MGLALGPPDGDLGPVAGRRRESYAERRERRAEVEDPAVVLEAAARFLETRSRSVAEVRRRLTGAGYRPELVEHAIARLGDLGMLDDEAFARAWVESRDRARPRGERALQNELRLKGIDRALVDAVLDERRSAEGVVLAPDRDAAERLIEKHARSLDRIADPRRRRERAYALLARNGFDPETCREVAARVTARDADDELDQGLAT
jgi:regulatory protein